MISRTTVFDKIRSEPIIFDGKAVDKKVNYPHFIIGFNGLIKRNREKINLRSVMSLYEFHVVKIQNPAFFEESAAP
jgi:hypothetical protein